MKRIIYTLALVCLTSVAFSQQSVLDPNGSGSPSRPVIDNISANSIGIGIINERELVLSSGTKNGADNGHLDPQNNDGNGIQGSDAAGGFVDKIFESIKENMKMYPNPANDYVIINLGEYAEVEISILNIIGKRVYYLKEETNMKTIALDQLPQGSYFLTIRRGENIIAKRLEISGN